MIHLGYETGTGKAVSIPLAHMAITGQTQQSGKTTTLEALIDRGNVRAVVFVTKPGEKSFAEGRRIVPFFKERADWEYVKELLEARLNESLGSKVGYLMRACSRAKTLAQVRANITAELPEKKSARPSMYEVLAGYIDLIIAEMERVPYTDKLELARGVNIMDLTGMGEEMQSLVIRSTIERIHKHEKNTVLVMPEAWKFIPEGGRSPIFQALHTLIREGATNGNYIWIDAQDLAVVSKRILKSVSVWVLGKQQEANEVARTINHLIDPIRIRPDMIKSLGIGQFLICADNHPARRVYVQPRWLGELDAQAIARGEESVETAQAIFREKKRELTRVRSGRGQIQVIEETAHDKHTERETGIRPDEGSAVSIGRGNGHSDRSDSEAGEPGSIVRGGAESEAAAAAAPAPAGTRGIDEAPQAEIQTPEIERGYSGGSRTRTRGVLQNGGSGIGNDLPRIQETENEDDAMWKERAEQAEAKLNLLRMRILQLERDRGRTPDGGSAAAVPPNGNGGIDPYKHTLEQIYYYVKDRALDDPGILQLLTARPELRVRVEPKIIEISDTTLRGWIAVLISKDWFKSPRNGNTTYKELVRIGKRMDKRSVYREMDELATAGFLTKEPDGYQSTGVKVTVTK